MFASLAIVAMLATAIPTTVLGAASYSDELQGAYDYAYGVGITTQSAIATADMYGSLKRSHMAKMMVNYAKEVLGQTPNAALSCDFSDVSNESAELQGYITEACQMGLMGVGITAFNPNGYVTRAQFGTVLSRALYGDANNVSTNPYYAQHLQALKDAGIMTMISNPDQLEVRGYVMLMMQRADEGVSTPAICTTPENVLSCSLGLNTCPSECQAVQAAKSGTLSVSAVGASYSSVPNTGSVKFATVTFTAGSEDVNVYGVTFEKRALSDIPSATRMYFEKEGARVSSKASFSQNKATVSFSTALAVKAGATETVDLYVLLNGSTVGNEYQFASTYIDASAATVDGTITTPLMRTLSYNIATVNMSGVVDTTSYKVDANQLVELGQFSLNSFTNRTDKDLKFKAVTLNQSGNASLSYLSDLGLYRDDVKVSTKTTVDGRNVSFVLNDTISSTSSSTINYVVKGKITNADRVGDTYQFAVRYPENTLVEEVGTMFKATILNGTTVLNLSMITVNGADLKFNQPATSYTKDVVPGSLAVVFYTGTISSLDAVTLQNPTLKFDGGVMTGTDVLRTIYFKIGNTVLSANAPSTITGDVTFDGTVSVNGTVQVAVYADVKDTAIATNIKFTNTIGLSTFGGPNEYASNGQAIASAIGSLSPITNTVVAAGLQMTNTYSNAQNVQKGDRDVKLADLKFSTTTDIISKVSSFSADYTGYTYSTGSNTPTNFQGGTVTVYDANGVALVSQTISASNAHLNFVLPSVVNVSKTSPATFTLKIDQIANTVTGNDTLILNFGTGIVARNFITNNNIYPTAAAASSTVTVVAAGTVTTVAQSFNAKLLQLNGSTVSLGTLKFKPFNGNATLKNVYLRLSGYSTTDLPYSEIVLKDSGVVVASLLNSGTNNMFPFATNINQTMTVDVTKTYDVVATLKNATTSGNLGSSFKLILLSAGFESMNGVTIQASPVNAIVSSITEFVKAKPTISLTSFTRVGNNGVYKFTIASNGGDMKLNALSGTVTNNTNTTGAFLTGTLYLGNEGGTSLGVVSANGTLNFPNLSGLVNITNGSSASFTLVIPVATWYIGSSSAAGNIGVEMANISYYDTFSDSSEFVHNNMFGSYKWDIAPVSTSAVAQ